MKPRVSPQGRRGLGRLVLVAVAAVAACERPHDVTAPDDAAPQFAPGVDSTVVQFIVTAGPGGGPVNGAFVSLYETDLTQSPRRLVTGPNGIASIKLPVGARIGYLARVHGHIDFTKTAPPASPVGTSSNYNNLDALTCAATGPVTFSGQALNSCIQNRHLTVVKVPKTQDVLLPLPVAGNVAVKLKGLNGEDLPNAEAFLIEELPQFFPWHGQPPNTLLTPGFLRFFGSGQTILLPNKSANIEAKAKTSNGVTIAASLKTSDLAPNGEVYLVPQLCVAPDAEEKLFKLERTTTLPEFTFQKAWWSYAANDVPGPSPLVRDPSAVSAIIEFAQTAGPLTVEFTVRHRTSMGTQTAVISVSCTNGNCPGAASAVAQLNGAGNVLAVELSQARSGKLVLLVRNADPTAVLEWGAKAIKPGKKPTVLDQIPDPSRAESSSAMMLFYAFGTCDPNRSFDKTFDINW